MGYERCRKCGAPKAAIWLGDVPLDVRRDGCARGEPVRSDGFCASMKIDLLSMALRRAVMPEAFDENSRILPDMLIAVLDAERDAIRSAALTKGPMAVPAPPPKPQETP